MHYITLGNQMDPNTKMGPLVSKEQHERVSRYHAKVQQDGDDIILTDLESTNGTRVNGAVVQIRRLRYGDRVCVGRSLLLYGSNDALRAHNERMAQLEGEYLRRLVDEGLRHRYGDPVPAEGGRVAADRWPGR